MKDPEEPEPELEPESEELAALLTELYDDNAAAGGVDPPRLSAPEKAALQRTNRHGQSELRRALSALHEDPDQPGPAALADETTDSDAPAAAIAAFAPPAPVADPRETERQRAEYLRNLAWMAARAVVQKSPRSLGEQRALNIPDAVLTPDGQGWQDAVLASLKSHPPERIFGAWVRSLELWKESPVLNQLAAEAAARLPSIAPFVEDLVVMQRKVTVQRSTSFAAILQAAPVDAAMARLLTRLIDNLADHSSEVQLAIGELAGSVAQKRPELAMAIAAAARRWREIPYPLQQRNLSIGQALAAAVRCAAQPGLAATAALGLTIGHTAVAREWAQALMCCDQGLGLRYLLDPERGIIGHHFGIERGIDIAAATISVLPRSKKTEALRRDVFLEHPDPYLRLEVAYKNPDPRRRLVEVCAILASLEAAPGWVALYPQRDRVLRFLQEKYVKADWTKLAGRYGHPLRPLPAPLPPLQAVTATHTDLRHRALRNLAEEGRPEHLLAALLAADLDRALEAQGHSAVWRFVPWGRWPKLRLDTLDHRLTSAGLTTLLTLVHRLSQLGLLGEQRLTPELTELLRIGAPAYATRYPAREFITLEDCAALYAAEGAFITSTPDRPN